MILYDYDHKEICTDHFLLRGLYLILYILVLKDAKQVTSVSQIVCTGKNYEHRFELAIKFFWYTTSLFKTNFFYLFRIIYKKKKN